MMHIIVHLNKMSLRTRSTRSSVSIIKILIIHKPRTFFASVKRYNIYVFERGSVLKTLPIKTSKLLRGSACKCTLRQWHIHACVGQVNLGGHYTCASVDFFLDCCRGPLSPLSASRWRLEGLDRCSCGGDNRIGGQAVTGWIKKCIIITCNWRRSCDVYTFYRHAILESHSHDCLNNEYTCINLISHMWAKISLIKSAEFFVTRTLYLLSWSLAAKVNKERTLTFYRPAPPFENKTRSKWRHV